MTITGTRVRSRTSLPGDHYRCLRCGFEAKFNRGRGRPTLCGDCQEVETILSKTGPTP